MGYGSLPLGLRRAAPGGRRLEERCHAPKKPIVEHLSTKQVSQDVLNILKIAQERVGAFIQGRTPVQGAS